MLRTNLKNNEGHRVSCCRISAQAKLSYTCLNIKRFKQNHKPIWLALYCQMCVLFNAYVTCFPQSITYCGILACYKCVKIYAIISILHKGLLIIYQSSYFFFNQVHLSRPGSQCFFFFFHNIVTRK